MTAPAETAESPLYYRLVNVSLAVGFSLLLGWKLHKWTGHSGSSSSWSDWLTPSYKLVLVVRGDLPLRSRAMVAANCSSASILAYKTAARQTPWCSFIWSLTGQRKVVLRTPTGYEFPRLCEEATKRQVCTSLVQEKMNNERVESTVLAIGPGPSGLLDQVTGHLKLY